MANVYSIDWQMKRYNISKEDAINKINDIKYKIKLGQEKLSDFDRKAMSSKNKEHWIKKGLSEEEAIIKANNQINDMQLAYQKKKKDNPTKYKSSFNINKEYWIKKGFSEKEAIDKVKERQATNSKQNFIKRYGEKEGLLKWNNRQKQWQTTLNSKSINEKNRINSMKGITLANMQRKWGETEGITKYNNWIENRHSFYSDKSQDFFKEIIKFIKDTDEVFFATHNGEKFINYCNKNYAYDFFYNNKIIEFNGDKFHANPNLYESSDSPNPFTKLTSAEIWEKDKEKINVAKKYNYKVLIIWEFDYDKNKQSQINKALNFLDL